MRSNYAKLALFTPLALVVLYCADLYYLISRSDKPDKLLDFFLTSDFMPTVVGARLIAAGRGTELYNLDAQLQAQADLLTPYYALRPQDLLPYNHLPFEALAVTPLQGLPYLLITLLWSLFLLACAWITARLLAARVGAWSTLWLALAIISYYPVFRSLELGQNSLIVLLGLALSFVGVTRRNDPLARDDRQLAASRRNDLLAGVGLALICLKPQVYPLVAVAALLLGRWRALLISLGILAGLSLAAMPILGVGWPLDYARLLTGVAGWEQDTINPLIMHNWRGLLENTLGGIAPWLATPLYVILSALSLAALVVVWKRNRDDPQVVWAMGVLVAVLVSPHLNPHDLTLLVIPGYVLARRGQWALPLIGYVLAPAGHFSRLGSLWVVASVLLTASAALYLTLNTRRSDVGATRRVVQPPEGA